MGIINTNFIYHLLMYWILFNVFDEGIVGRVKHGVQMFKEKK